jgi:hypothetical protein
MRYRVTFSSGKSYEIGADQRAAITRAMGLGSPVLELTLDGIPCVVNADHISIVAPIIDVAEENHVAHAA